MTQKKRNFLEKDMQKKKWQLGAGSYSQGDEMAEERRNVSHQQGKTPGRRGEQIKQEEIDIINQISDDSSIICEIPLVLYCICIVYPAIL
jgi:hypothetical protein